MKILLVTCHPRDPSFTHAVAEKFAAGCEAAGHEIEWAKLYQEGFDPLVREADEPDWENTEKVYSPEVLAEMARVDRNDAIVMVFPVWWWSVPAMLKGWIDRVWNLGWAYGPRKLPHEKALMIGVAAASQEQFDKRGYGQAIQTQLSLGVLNYCGVESHKVALLCGSTDDNQTRLELLAQAEEMGRQF